MIRGRTCGQTDLRSPDDPRLIAAYEELISQSAIESGGEAELGDILLEMGQDRRTQLLSSLLPEDFEKDDAALGHVDFAAAAANLRCKVYSLRGVDRLEVQKVSTKMEYKWLSTATDINLFYLLFA